MYPNRPLPSSKKPSLLKRGQVQNLSCENKFYLHDNKTSFSEEMFCTWPRFKTEGCAGHLGNGPLLCIWIFDCFLDSQMAAFGQVPSHMPQMTFPILYENQTPFLIFRREVWITFDSTAYKSIRTKKSVLKIIILNVLKFIRKER